MNSRSVLDSYMLEAACSSHYDRAAWIRVEERLARALNESEEKNVLKDAKRLRDEQVLPRSILDLVGVQLKDYMPLRCSWLWTAPGLRTCLASTGEPFACDEEIQQRVFATFTESISPATSTKLMLINVKESFGFSLEDGSSVGMACRRRVLLTPELEDLLKISPHPFISIPPPYPSYP